MQLIVVLTAREIEFCKAFAQLKYEFTYAGAFDAFRNEWKNEIIAFREHGLIYHSNPDSDSYIKYELTELGEKTIETYFEIKL